MAVAEARAAWQRTANRCLVQEDAKRAPKLACCPSASPSVKQVDTGPANATDGQDSTNLNFLPYKQNPSYSNLSPNSRWWLQHQPDYGYQRAFANEQLNLPETEMESVGSNGSSFTKVSGKDEELYIDETYMDLGARKHEVEVFNDKKNLENSPKVEDIREYYEIPKRDSVGCVESKKLNEVCFDSESDWFGDGKTEPWWRTADKDELAHLVAQRSLSLVENCDLPQPQKAPVKRDPFDDLSSFDHEGIYASSVDPKPGIGGFSRFSKLTPGRAFNRKWESVERQFQPVPDNHSSRADKAMPEAHIYENDPSKARLLEALRHSQTRAREAEIAAKKAYAEKEHIVELVFRQASQLFAYKQWFHLLQLENLYVHIRNDKNQPITTVVPVMVPLVPHRSRKVRKNWHRAGKGKQGKRGRCIYDIGKFAVAFAVGLSLVGAGLLLGWTVGWMF